MNHKDAQDAYYAKQLTEMGFKTPTERLEVWVANKDGKFLGPYVKSGQKASFECKRQHLFSATPNNVLRGLWCKKCQDEDRIADCLRRAQEKAIERGGTLLSVEYDNSYSSMAWRCGALHEWKATFSDVVTKDTWCLQCARKEQKNTLEDCQRFAATKDGSVVSTVYINSWTHLRWRCKEGHEWDAIPNNVLTHGRWCPQCWGKGVSGAQQELAAFVCGLGIEVVECDRSVIGPFEIDIWVPSKRLAIEYNGLYWHSDAVGEKQRGRHYKKFQALRAAGCELFAIFEDEWIKKRALVEAMLRHRLGVSTATVLNARDLERRPVDSAEAGAFMEAYHLDGAGGRHSGFGLAYQGILVAVMTTRRNFNQEFEIARFATNLNYRIRGAAGKLLAAFERPIVSFSNNRLSSGAVYERLDFKLVQENPSSYWYTDGREVRIPRFRCRRINEPEILAQYPTEAAQAAGGVFAERILGEKKPLYRIEDYGHRKWELI